MTQEVTPLPAIGISFQSEVEPGRTVVFQTHLPHDINPDQLDTLLDKFADSSDRQIAKYMLQKLERTLEAVERKQDELLEDDKRAEADIEEKFNSSDRRTYKLSNTEENNRIARASTLKANTEELRRVKVMIAEAQAKVTKTPAK